ncbi:DNA polymerase III subunit epsilon [Sphingomonas sp. SKA58]|nr:DNA polymerase III subunit epsilon [Sphingomonas sp. SKA58]
MPIVWAVLAIALCEDEEVQVHCRSPRRLQTANAIEARVMWTALRKGGDMSRGIGHRKLANRGEGDATFRALARQGAYVTQPLRMRTVQALPALGFVSSGGTRFNDYSLAEPGGEICEIYRREYNALKRWMMEYESPKSLKHLFPSGKVREEARQIIQRQLLERGRDSNRRRALQELGMRGAALLASAKACPPPLSRDHFADIRAGIAFIDLRDAALAVLNQVENYLQKQGGRPSKATCGQLARNTAVAEKLAFLTSTAKQMLDHVDSSSGHSAHSFARICLGSATNVISSLARRDGTVVIEQGDHLFLGPAAGGEIEESTAAENHSMSEENDYPPQLPRIANFYALLEDLA